MADNTKVLSVSKKTGVSSRVSGTVQELVLAFPTTVQYFAEISFWCNGKFTYSNIDYYVES